MACVLSEDDLRDWVLLQTRNDDGSLDRQHEIETSLADVMLQSSLGRDKAKTGWDPLL